LLGEKRIGKRWKKFKSCSKKWKSTFPLKSNGRKRSSIIQKFHLRNSFSSLVHQSQRSQQSSILRAIPRPLLNLWRLCKLKFLRKKSKKSRNWTRKLKKWKKIDKDLIISLSKRCWRGRVSKGSSIVCWVDIKSFIHNPNFPHPLLRIFNLIIVI
jgi:hypothetical protein